MSARVRLVLSIVHLNNIFMCGPPPAPTHTHTHTHIHIHEHVRKLFSVGYRHTAVLRATNRLTKLQRLVRRVNEVSHNDFKKYLHLDLLKQWNEVTTRQAIPSEDKYLRTHRIQKKSTRLRLGHTLLTHKHVFTNETPAKCNNCDTALTTFHLFQIALLSIILSLIHI